MQKLCSQAIPQAITCVFVFHPLTTHFQQKNTNRGAKYSHIFSCHGFCAFLGSTVRYVRKLQIVLAWHGMEALVVVLVVVADFRDGTNLCHFPSGQQLKLRVIHGTFQQVVRMRKFYYVAYTQFFQYKPRKSPYKNRL